ncbi:MAG TPA: DinB family protein [Gemmatimonadaceae bacterium]|nr:DinB family protein [Gemmatimonadaceae bacterium]
MARATRVTPRDPAARALVAAYDEAYDTRSWHGTNLRGSIRGMSARDAARRPARGRHNAWEIVVHCAYWKYTVLRRLTRARRGSFALKGSNWFPRTGDGGEAQWRADVALLEETHRALRTALVTLNSRQLRERRQGGKYRVAELVSGITAHDLYHAGQIQLLKRLDRL